jgi:hypothetical protein
MRTGLAVKTDSEIAALLSGQIVKQFSPGRQRPPAIHSRTHRGA